MVTERWNCSNSFRIICRNLYSNSNGCKCMYNYENGNNHSANSNECYNFSNKYFM
ncbi:hypothetical protein D3C87_2042110 [compost metagenome]